MPDLESLKLLAEALNVPIEQLIYGDVSPKHSKIRTSVGAWCY